MSINLDRLCRKLGYRFKSIPLLTMALTHRSMHSHNNERLEFLGDALLNFIIASALFRKYPEAQEGQLTRIRSDLVKGETLALIAKEFGLGEYLHLGIGELKSGGRTRNSILANAVEALIAAVYLDSNLEKCEERVLSWFAERLNNTTVTNKKDAKTELQEYLQSKRIPIPHYIIVSTTGDTHDQIFNVECHVEKFDYVGRGEGTSRRRAEQQAADQVLTYLKQNAFIS